MSAGLLLLFSITTIAILSSLHDSYLQQSHSSPVPNIQAHSRSQSLRIPWRSLAGAVFFALRQAHALRQTGADSESCKDLTAIKVSGLQPDEASPSLRQHNREKHDLQPDGMLAQSAACQQAPHCAEAAHNESGSLAGDSGMLEIDATAASQQQAPHTADSSCECTGEVGESGQRQIEQSGHGVASQDRLGREGASCLESGQCSQALEESQTSLRHSTYLLEEHASTFKGRAQDCQALDCSQLESDQLDAHPEPGSHVANAAASKDHVSTGQQPSCSARLEMNEITRPPASSESSSNSLGSVHMTAEHSAAGRARTTSSMVNAAG